MDGPLVRPIQNEGVDPRSNGWLPSSVHFPGGGPPGAETPEIQNSRILAFTGGCRPGAEPPEFQNSRILEFWLFGVGAPPGRSPQNSRILEF